MIPSKKLRLIISRNHKINLENYAWNDEFKSKIFNTEFYDGKKRLKLNTIFKNGYNVGNCLLTSYHVSSIIEDSLICTGRVLILKGTKNSPNGDHVWIETEDLIIDTTLMIILPKTDKYAKYYIKDSTISPVFSTEQLNYDGDMYEKKNHIHSYFHGLYQIE